MRYLVLVITDADPDPGSEAPGEIETWFADVEGRGAWVTGDRLRPAEDARTVRVRAGELLVTDGPSAGSERVVGFDVLECAGLEEAVEIASRHPMARFGRLELRPVWPLEG